MVFERNPLPRMEVASREELHRWLSQNHGSSRGIWLVGSRFQPAVPYDDIVEECLIFGWIDSTIRTRDEQTNELRLTPRRPGSVWSALNKQRLERLQRAARMHPAGEAVVERAKADGSFDFLDDVEALVLPDDLAEALGPHLAVFEEFTPGRRKQALYWVKSAKRPDTRMRRIEQIAIAAARGESLF